MPPVDGEDHDEGQELMLLLLQPPMPPVDGEDPDEGQELMLL